MKIFGFEIRRSKDQDIFSPENNILSTNNSSEKSRLSAIIPPENDDGSFTVETLYNAFLLNSTLNINFKDDIDLVRNYRQLAEQPEVDRAIDEIVNECIVLEDNYEIVYINLDDMSFVSETFKESIRTEFRHIIKLLHFNLQAYNIFRQWYIDGRFYYNLVIDFDKPEEGIKELIPISPFHIRKIREIVKEKNNYNVDVIKEIKEYYIFDDTGKFGGQVLKIPLDSICYIHSGLVDDNTGTVLSYLHKALKPINQLRLMEDGMIIYRLARAPERRVFYVDVGDLLKVKAEQYIKSLMDRFKNKLSYDAVTGNVRDNRNQLSMMEDFWIPRRSEGRTTEIQTLPGASNTNNTEEINYFLDKVYNALNIPVSRLNSESPTGLNLGRQAEITRDELKFTKFVRRLQAQFSSLFFTLLRVQLLLKNVISVEDWEDIKDFIKFEFEKDNYYTDSKNAAILKDKLEILTTIDQFIGKYFSREFMYKDVMNFSDEEIDAIKEQMKNDILEDKKKEEENTESVTNENSDEGTGDESFDNQSEETTDDEPKGTNAEAERLLKGLDDTPPSV